MHYFSPSKKVHNAQFVTWQAFLMHNAHYKMHNAYCTMHNAQLGFADTPRCGTPLG